MTREARIASGLVVALAAAAYAFTVNTYFIQDDFGVVWLLSHKPATYFPRWFVTTWMDNIWGYTPDEIRPFPAVTYQLAALAGAGTPFANHAINIAFHAGTALLVLQIARGAAGLGLPAATLAATLFVLFPNQAETAAWITGRVDSMPAIFYLASFLAFVRWRDRGERRLYAWSVLWCFVALFSKQTTITLGPALVLYDIVMLKRRPTVTWTWLRPYAPFAVLTAAYLMLRYVLFGEVAREQFLTTARVAEFMRDAANHVMRVVMGAESLGGIGGQAVALAVIAFLIGWWGSRGRRAEPSLHGRSAVYFGLVWTALGIVPTLVATYVSPRHAYLASVGWALAAGVAFDRLWRTQARVARVAAAAGSAALIVAYGIQLRLNLLDWDARGALSRKAVADVERIASVTPDGTLILTGVTARAWQFALPYALMPPFTRTDVTERVSVISPAALHCCGVYPWDAYTRDRLHAWLSNPSRPPAIALQWDTRTGALTRLSSGNDPSLRSLIELLVKSEDYVALDANIGRLLNDFVPYNGRASRE